MLLRTRNITACDVHPDKRRKIGSGKPAAVVSVGRERQPLAAVNNQQDGMASASDLGGAEGSESESVEFTKEEVEALLNERIRGKKFDIEGKVEQMNEFIRKWLQEFVEGHVQDKEKLQSNLESSERKLTETEAAMKNKEVELNSIITELELNNTLLQENLDKEESEKLDAIECYRREKEAKIAAEKLQASLREELEQEKLSANQRISSLDDRYKILQKHNTTLQQYNAKLQTDLATADESLKHVENEKATIIKNLTTLRGHYNALQDHLTSSKDAIEYYRRETEAKIAAEKSQASLREELRKAEEVKLSANQRVSSLLDEQNKLLLKGNTSWEQRHTKLQTDHATIVQQFITLTGHYNALQEQLTSSKASQDESVKQKEALLKEVNCIRGELQHVKEDRDRQFTQVQELSAEIAKYKATRRKSIAELDNLSPKSHAVRHVLHKESKYTYCNIR